MRFAPTASAGRRRLSASLSGIERRDMLVLFSVAWVLRLAWVLHVAAGDDELAVFSDSAGYLDPAHSLLDEGSFDVRAGTDDPMWLRTPGYPSFLAGVAVVFGRSLDAVLVVQTVIGALTVVIVYAAASMLAGRRAALVAALLLALDPFSILATGHVLTETLAAFLMAAFVGAVVRAFHQPSTSGWLAAGGLLALASLVRPTTYYFTPALILMVVWCGRVDRRRVGRFAVAFALPTVLLIGGWQVRNQIVVDSLQYTTLDASNLALWRGAAVEYRTGDYATYRDAQLAVAERVARAVGVTDPDASDLLRAYPPEGVDQAVYWSAMRAEGLRLLRSEPGMTADETMKGFRSLLFDAHNARSQYATVLDHSATVPSLRIMLLVEYVAAAIGLFALGRGPQSARRRSAWFLALVLALVVAASSGPESEERIRTPMLPIVFVFAGAGAAARSIAQQDRKSISSSQSLNGPS